LGLVPGLPILGDLSIFLSYFQYRRPGEVRPPTENPSAASNVSNPYTPTWRSYLWHGDRHLYILAHSAASTLFGKDNQILIHRVLETWNTNRTMALLAQCYRLDYFVGVDTKASSELYGALADSKGQENKRQLKLWANFWEAWFGAVILERNRWGRNDTEDLVDIIRNLIYLQFEELIDKYSTNYRRIPSGLFPLRWFTRLILVGLPSSKSDIPPYQISVRQIDPTDEAIKRYIWADNQQDVYGYLATSTATTTSSSNDVNTSTASSDPTICSIFAVDEKSAKIKLLNVLKSAYKGESTSSRFQQSNLSCTRRLLVIRDKLLQA
jgi:hypothetical protein